MSIKHDARKSLGNIIAAVLLSPLKNLLPLNTILENEYLTAFYHPQPNYKTHIVIVPLKKILSLDKITKSDLTYIQEIYKVLPEIILTTGLNEKGYSLIVNGGKKQDINQLHFHLVSDETAEK